MQILLIFTALLASADAFKRIFQTAAIYATLNLASIPSTLPMLSTPMTTILVAHADDTDKKFETCLSKCIYQQTRPPPVGSPTERLEQKLSRGEILTLCKEKCAVNKEQLLTGKPKVKAEK